MFTGIPHTEIDSVWNDVLPWVEIACRHNAGRMKAEDYYALIKARNMQLWVYGKDACCITEIINYPHKKYCCIRLGNGTRRANWQNSVLIIEQWAKSQGCDGIETLCRPGWFKIFKSLSNLWKQTHVFIEKEL